MSVHRQVVMVTGTALETVWYGPPPQTAPTLVFLHEGLGCVSIWRDFPAKVAHATGWSALVYSRQGYGRSAPLPLPWPVRYMHREGLEVLPAFLEVIGVRECILIGHSDGASIALIYAGGTPAVPLRGIIAEAPHVFREDVCFQSIQNLTRTYEDSTLRQRLKRHHGDNADTAFWGWSGAWLHPDFAQWNLEEYLVHIRVPILVIQGEDDPYGTLAQATCIQDQSGATTEVLSLADCGHTPHRDQEEATLQAMVRFIERVGGLAKPS